MEGLKRIGNVMDWDISEAGVSIGLVFGISLVIGFTLSV